jgi:hypothetical protein
MTGDINVSLKDNYNAALVELMKDTFELDVLSDLSHVMIRSNSYIDMVFGAAQLATSQEVRSSMSE